MADYEECVNECAETCRALYPKTDTYIILEIGLIVLVIALVILGLYIGFKRIKNSNK